MVRANLLRFPVLPAPRVVQLAAKRLICAPHHRSQRLLAAINIPALTPEMRLCLLGKAPLRFIASRAEVMPGKVWVETLECGHEVTAYQNFLWDEKQHLVNLEPTAKRRRCQECKAGAIDGCRSRAGGSKTKFAVAPALPPRKPVQSVPDPRKKRAA